MARASLHMYALRRAVDVLGGVAELAARLGISQTRLKLYLADLAPLPELVFRDAVAPRTRIERATCPLGGGCSIH